jgi:hypothetical protein
MTLPAFPSITSMRATNEIVSPDAQQSSGSSTAVEDDPQAVDGSWMIAVIVSADEFPRKGRAPVSIS